MQRNINTLRDAERAIKELQDWKDSQTSRNLDFHQRQIKNAHPSIDDYDYVVRKELKDFEPVKRSITITGGGGTTTTTGQIFEYIAILPLPEIATDVMENRRRIREITALQKIVLIEAYATSRVDPGTGSFIANILRSDDASVSFDNLFTGSNRISILIGAHRGQQTNFAITELFRDDELRIDVSSVGGAEGVEIALVGRVELI